MALGVSFHSLSLSYEPWPRGWDTQGPLDNATAMMATGPSPFGGHPFSLTWSLMAANAVNGGVADDEMVR